MDITNGYKDRLGTAKFIIQGHPVMARLQNISQLGELKRILGTSKAYSHTRYDHSMCVGDKAAVVYDHLVQKGCSVSWECIPAAFLHDLGHTAYSHTMEAFLKQWYARTHNGAELRGHNERTLELFESSTGPDGSTCESLRDLLAKVGVNPTIIKRYMAKHERGSEGRRRGDDLIENSIVGVDKSMYLWMDSDLIIFDQSPQDYNRLIPYLTIQDNGLGIDVLAGKEDPEAMVLAKLSFYFRMYLEMYFGEATQVAQRHLQRAVEEDLRVTSRDVDIMWWWKDGDLDTALRTSKSDRARDLFTGYERKRLFEKAIVFKLEHNPRVDEDERHQRVVGKNFQDAFQKRFGGPMDKTVLEEAIEREFDVRVLCTGFRDPEKINPKGDLPVYKKVETIGTLEELHPEFFAHLRQRVRRAWDIGLCFHTEDLPRVHKRWRDIADFVEARTLAPQPTKDAQAQQASQ